MGARAWDWALGFVSALVAVIWLAAAPAAQTTAPAPQAPPQEPPGTAAPASVVSELQAELNKHPRERSDTALSDLGPDLNYRIIVEARQRAASATRGERERVVRASTDRVMAHIGFVAPLAHLFGLLDLLWIGLGVGSAWQLARGRTG